MNKPESRVGGAFPGYYPYPALQEWIAIGAMEDVFWQRLYKELGFHFPPSIQQLGDIFLTLTALGWQDWAE
jgi:hypothetical protein